MMGWGLLTAGLLGTLQWRDLQSAAPWGCHGTILRLTDHTGELRGNNEDNLNYLIIIFIQLIIIKLLIVVVDSFK